MIINNEYSFIIIHYVKKWSKPPLCSLKLPFEKPSCPLSAFLLFCLSFHQVLKSMKAVQSFSNSCRRMISSRYCAACRKSRRLAASFIS